MGHRLRLAVSLVIAAELVAPHIRDRREPEALCAVLLNPPSARWAPRQVDPRCSLLRDRSVGVVQYLPIHEEVFGFIEQALSICRLNVTYYYSKHMEPNMFLRLVNVGAHVVHPAGLRPHDVYIAPTSRDAFPSGIMPQLRARTVFFHHLPEDPSFREAGLHMTPLHSQRPVAVPYWCPAIRAADMPTRTDSVCIVGRLSSETHDLGLIHLLASRFVETRFRVLGRDHAITPPGLHYNTDLSPSRLVEELLTCGFIGLFPSANSYHLRDRLTGAIPLSIATNTPVLSSSRTICEAYGLRCTIMSAGRICDSRSILGCANPEVAADMSRTEKCQLAQNTLLNALSQVASRLPSLR